MKKAIVIAGAFFYFLLILICFAANAQTGSGPLVHIHTIREFRGKTIVKDTIFRADTAKIHAKMANRFRRRDKDSMMTGRHPMMRRDMGFAGRPWAHDLNRRMLKNADSIAINIHTRMHGDSMTRETRRIVYFNKTRGGKTVQRSDTLININTTVHHRARHRGSKDEGLNNPNGNEEYGTEQGSISAGSGSLDIADLKVYPNPGDGLYRLRFSLPANAPVALSITDISGKTVWQETITDFTGKYDKTIDISAQAKGIFMLQIAQNNKTMQQKLVNN